MLPVRSGHNLSAAPSISESPSVFPRQACGGLMGHRNSESNEYTLGNDEMSKRS